MRILIHFMLVIIICLVSCEREPKDYEILVVGKNELTGYFVYIEDYGYYYWAVMYSDKSKLSPLCSCFVVTTKNPLEESEMPAPFNGNLPISKRYASADAVFLDVDVTKTDFRFLWNSSGNSVTVFFRNNPFCFLDGESMKSFTKSVKEESSYGSTWHQRQ